MTDSSEKWSITKQFTITKKRIWKLVNYAWIICIILLMGMGIVFIKTILFPHKSSNVTNPEIHVASGGTSNYTVIQKTQEKRPWWCPIPFVEVFGEIKTDEHNPALGGRTGARWEF